MKDKELRELLGYNGENFAHYYNRLATIKELNDEIYGIRQQVKMISDKMGCEFKHQTNYPVIELVDKEPMQDKELRVDLLYTGQEDIPSIPQRNAENIKTILDDIYEIKKRLNPKKATDDTICPTCRRSLKEGVVITPNAPKKEYP